MTDYTTIPVPASREEAISALVELDVARWGEQERDASRRLHTGNLRTYGRALNALSVRPEYDYGDAVPHLRAAARAALTSDDWAELRQGG